ncbi:MAG: hypothetical protein NVS9B7_29510 [Flavisolibacter sp.]
MVNSKSNEIINSVKSGYTVSQNEEVVKMVLGGIAPFGDRLKVTKGGSLNGGRKVYLQIEVEGFSKVGEDLIKKFITVIDSNDGSTGLSIGIGDLTMSCQNQFWKFYKSGEAKFRHTATLEQKIQTIPYLIKTALNESMQMVELYNRFQSTPITRELTHKLVNYLLGTDRTDAKLSEQSTRTINQMNELYGNIETEMIGKGLNLWGLHSGVTRWTTHDKSAPTRENGRIESSMIGTNYRTNQQSIEFAMGILGK